MKFETLEEMIKFYEANKDEYEVTFGVNAKLYRRQGVFLGDCVAEIEAPFSRPEAFRPRSAT